MDIRSKAYTSREDVMMVESSRIDRNVVEAYEVRGKVEDIIDEFVRNDNTDLDSNGEKGIIDAKWIKSKIGDLKDVSGIYNKEENSLEAKGISEEDKEVKVEYFEKENSLTGGLEKSYQLGNKQAIFNDENTYSNVTLVTYSDSLMK